MPTKTRKPFSWYGGKGKMVPVLLQLIPPHRIYVEVFGGAAALLFAKEPSEVEIYNDIDSRLVNFFRVLRNEQQFAQLLRKLQNTPYAREEFEAMKNQQQTGDPVEDAFRFFYIAACTRNGLQIRPLWYTPRHPDKERGMPNTLHFRQRVRNLAQVRNRFRSVYVEHKDFQEILQYYDSEDTFFYLDPPYLPSARREQRQCYPHDMDESDHIRMLETVQTLKGKVMISGYENPLYETYLRGWHLYRKESRLYSSVIFLKHKSVEKCVECIWTNYTPVQHSLESYWTEDLEDEPE